VVHFVVALRTQGLNFTPQFVDFAAHFAHQHEHFVLHVVRRLPHVAGAMIRVMRRMPAPFTVRPAIAVCSCREALRAVGASIAAPRGRPLSAPRVSLAAPHTRADALRAAAVHFVVAAAAHLNWPGAPPRVVSLTFGSMPIGAPLTMRGPGIRPIAPTFIVAIRTAAVPVGPAPFAALASPFTLFEFGERLFELAPITVGLTVRCFLGQGGRGARQIDRCGPPGAANGKRRQRQEPPHTCRRKRRQPQNMPNASQECHVLVSQSDGKRRPKAAGPLSRHRFEGSHVDEFSPRDRNGQFITTHLALDPQAVRHPPHAWMVKEGGLHQPLCQIHPHVVPPDMGQLMGQHGFEHIGGQTRQPRAG
jgi:hypothetical protein